MLFYHQHHISKKERESSWAEDNLDLPKVIESNWPTNKKDKHRTISVFFGKLCVLVLPEFPGW